MALHFLHETIKNCFFFKYIQTYLSELFARPDHIAKALGTHKRMVVLRLEQLLGNGPVQRRGVPGGVLPIEADLGEKLIDGIGRLSTAGRKGS